MDKLRFGTAGIPVSTEGDTIKGIQEVRNKFNLECMELEFVRGVYLKEDKTEEVKKVAKKKDVVLTCHAPYWINLNSAEAKKYHASINFILNSVKIASLCGGFSVCFHAGYYQKQSPEVVYKKIRDTIKEIVKKVREFDKGIWIRPEISGKKSQFGDLKETLRLSQELEQVAPCVDFAHFYSRELGRHNTEEEFKQILEEIENKLGKEALNKMHIHVSGIEFGERGEKHHVILEESEFNYKALLKVLKEFKVKGVVICESPNIEGDAVLMRDYYENYEKV